MFKLTGQKILIISNEPWGEVWFSKHHYAHELAAKGNSVIFVNPAPAWRISNLFGPRIRTRKVHDNLTVLDYVNVLPSRFLNLNNSIVSRKIKKYLHANSFAGFIFWTFDPIRLFDPKKLGALFGVFHVMDKYRFVHPAEPLTHQNVNGFILVSASFSQYYEKYRKPMIVLPHAVSKSEFKLDSEIARKIQWPFSEERFVCYVGNIDVRLDFELIRSMASKFPEIPFLFVGQVKDCQSEIADELFVQKKWKNIFQIGPVPSAELKYYIERSVACIAPMSKSHAGNNISHHKIFQYLAWGKPVFSMVFSEYIPFSGLLYMEDNNDILLEKMDIFFQKGEDPALPDSRVKLVENLTFDKHFEKIEKFFNDFGN